MSDLPLKIEAFDAPIQRALELLSSRQSATMQLLNDAVNAYNDQDAAGLEKALQGLWTATTELAPAEMATFKAILDGMRANQQELILSLQQAYHERDIAEDDAMCAANELYNEAWQQGYEAGYEERLVDTMYGEEEDDEYVYPDDGGDYSFERDDYQRWLAWYRTQELEQRVVNYATLTVAQREQLLGDLRFEEREELLAEVQQ